MPVYSKARIQDLIAEEIQRRVSKAIVEQEILTVSDCVASIMAALPNSGLSKRRISDQILMAAARSGVAVQFGGNPG